MIAWCENIVLHISHTIVNILWLELVKQLTAAQLYINNIIMEHMNHVVNHIFTTWSL